MKIEQLIYTEKEKWQIIEAQNDCADAGLDAHHGNYRIVGETKWEDKTYESWIFEKSLMEKNL